MLKKAAPVKKEVKTISISFEIQAEPKGKIYVSGSFNSWKNKQYQLKEKKAGLYATKLKLEKGRYEYKYFINNNWSHDPAQESVWNDQGSQNNILYVG